MKKMNMYEAPKAEVIKMQNVSVLMVSGDAGLDGGGSGMGNE